MSVQSFYERINITTKVYEGDAAQKDRTLADLRETLRQLEKEHSKCTSAAPNFVRETGIPINPAPFTESSKTEVSSPSHTSKFVDCRTVDTIPACSSTRYSTKSSTTEVASSSFFSADDSAVPAPSPQAPLSKPISQLPIPHAATAKSTPTHDIRPVTSISGVQASTKAAKSNAASSSVASGAVDASPAIAPSALTASSSPTSQIPKPAGSYTFRFLKAVGYKGRHAYLPSHTNDSDSSPHFGSCFVRCDIYLQDSPPHCLSLKRQGRPFKLRGIFAFLRSSRTVSAQGEIFIFLFSIGSLLGINPSGPRDIDSNRIRAIALSVKRTQSYHVSAVSKHTLASTGAVKGGKGKYVLVPQDTAPVAPVDAHITVTCGAAADSTAQLTTRTPEETPEALPALPSPSAAAPVGLAAPSPSAAPTATPPPTSENPVVSTAHFDPTTATTAPATTTATAPGAVEGMRFPPSETDVGSSGRKRHVRRFPVKLDPVSPAESSGSESTAAAPPTPAPAIPTAAVAAPTVAPSPTAAPPPITSNSVLPDDSDQLPPMPQSMFDFEYPAGDQDDASVLSQFVHFDLGDVGQQDAEGPHGDARTGGAGHEGEGQGGGAEGVGGAASPGGQPSRGTTAGEP
ncbi:hypothetical protein HK102_000662 [Quaeritorhiza haematococci]|nr:hypothetical protein HK102_000662 [Quaeritorhiza haematococci]